RPRHRPPGLRAGHPGLHPQRETTGVAERRVVRGTFPLPGGDGMSVGRVHIGTSGWHYTYWKGPFYPAKWPSTRFLEHYVTVFDTTEINNSFYRLPKEETLTGWRDAVPEDFVFCVKGSRYITHM